MSGKGECGGVSIVQKFLNEQKEKEKKKKKKVLVADDFFSKEKWILAAAEIADKIVANDDGGGVGTHIGRFTHPSAKVSPIISKINFKNDGYLHSGNVKCELDGFGNAKYTPILKFLLMPMSDGETVIEHLEKNSQEIRVEMGISETDYNKVRVSFLALKRDSQEKVTDTRIKQVYFPVGDRYHLLSLLTPSGLLGEIKHRIKKMEDKKKEVKNEKNEKYGENYEEVLNLTKMKIGGSNFQNVSVNNKGEVLLLESKPPSAKKMKLRRPINDFFINTLWIKRFTEDFEDLHSLFKDNRNNKEVRDRVEKVLGGLIDNVMINVYELRKDEPGWSIAIRYADLPQGQKIWLDNEYAVLRETSDEWIDEVTSSFARWILTTYKSLFGSERVPIGDEEARFFRKQIKCVLLWDRGGI